MDVARRGPGPRGEIAVVLSGSRGVPRDRTGDHDARADRATGPPRGGRRSGSARGLIRVREAAHFWEVPSGAFLINGNRSRFSRGHRWSDPFKTRSHRSTRHRHNPDTRTPSRTRHTRGDGSDRESSPVNIPVVPIRSPQIEHRVPTIMGRSTATHDHQSPVVRQDKLLGRAESFDSSTVLQTTRLYCRGDARFETTSLRLITRRRRIGRISGRTGISHDPTTVADAPGPCGRRWISQTPDGTVWSTEGC